MLNVIIIGIGTLVGIVGVCVAVWSIRYTRRHAPKSSRLDKTAEKVYLAVVDFIAKTHQGQLPLEAVPPFEKLSEPLKNLYRDLAKRHFM